MPISNLHELNPIFFGTRCRCIGSTFRRHPVRILAVWRHGSCGYDAGEVFDEMPHRGKHGSVVVWTKLLSKYVRDGFVDEARELFELMPARNVVTYNAMLSGYVHYGRIVDACRLFDEMPERNVVSWTSMLNGLLNAGRVDDAKMLFECMPDRNVVSWNSMISGLIRNGELVEGRGLFDAMRGRNRVSWNIMISGYAESCRMEEARALFDAMTEPDVVTWTSLISGYCRVCDVEEGYEMFLKMPERNVVSWTAMISGFTWNGFYEEALLLFLEMKKYHNMRPNVETYISVVYACTGLGFHLIGKQVHAYLIVNGLDCDDYDGRLTKGLIHMYCEFGIMDFAHFMFTKNSNRCDIQSSNSMVSGFVRIGNLESAQQVFEMIPCKDQISWTSLITGYFNVGNVKEACCLFDKIPVRDSVVWTVMISGHVQNELFSEAMFLFSDMRVRDASPLNSTYSALLGAAGATANLVLGKQFHCLLIKANPNMDIILENSMISMYAKCGEIDGARSVFSRMMFRDLVTWNTMIMSFSYHGLAEEALDTFHAMQEAGSQPNSLTYLGVLLACSHAGKVDQAWELFNFMNSNYSTQPGIEHYVCMVDLLGRAGKVKEAEDFVMKLPFKPGIAIWGSLLGGCSIGELNVCIANNAAKQVLQLDPTNAPAHVLMCNIYAATGQRRKEGMLRKEMAVKGVKKVPGCSWIILKGTSHVFLSGDRSHPKAGDIFHLLCGDY
ncbi:hypothetical protein Syun_022498 [Stephania yunnanensis]|uniref:Pentatricopeptide repeat-containing protein n=1 Tax=Stephania yunnanensis TaxID=152371 RepID=A0AAP0FEB7_9MAGN